MAEPDFEDDLFADLYTEDDNTAKAPTTVPAVKAEVESSQTEITAENVNPQGDRNGGGDEQMYNGDQDGDDEIHFNLGDGDDPNSPQVQAQEHQPIGIKEDGKMFIGGLNWETTDQSLKDYFSQFGEVLECTVMRDGATGRSRGFGFLTFKDARTVNIVMVKEHYLDGKIIDPKRAIPRDEQERTSKIFVGGVSQEATEQDFKEFFMQFGRVVDATLMMDKDTGRPRGFGFVTFDNEAAVELCLEGPLEILGKMIEVKKAQPRGNMREEEDSRAAGAGRVGRFQKRGNESENSNQMAQGGGGNQMAPGGMTPQLMAQYWQRMQQYFAMMQQQQQMSISTGRGMSGGMNPAMMAQMAQFQQMQQQVQQGGNRSQSPQSPGMSMSNMQAMNPAMMAQMQQMQQMQMQGMGGGGGGGAGGMGHGYATGGGNNPGGNIGTPGYNAYEQQVFEQQKYEQQQVRRVQRDQSQFGAQGGGGGYGGGPTSWEGMYDDVPQPQPKSNGGGGRGGFQAGSRGGGVQGGSMPPQSGPPSAAPAGAPTGPKNPGKPGANYRGGGRGGNRGFHPYAR